jgi:hypothetical protein
MKILVVGENNQDRNERYLMKLDDIQLLLRAIHISFARPIARRRRDIDKTHIHTACPHLRSKF